MNKYLMMSAAAVFVGTGAQAGTLSHTFGFGTGGGGSYCDGGSLYTNGTSLWAWRHNNNNCSGAVSTGSGRNGKQGSFKGASMSDNLYAINYGASSIAVNFLLPKKIKKGAGWQLDVEFSGTTAFVGNSGPLINVTPGKHLPKSMSKNSTTTKLKSLIALHRSAKHG